LLSHLPGRSIEGEHRLDLRQLQVRWLLFLDLLDVQIVETAGQLCRIRLTAHAVPRRPQMG
jgi:hypothetical protein